MAKIKTTETGLSVETASALSYSLGPISGLTFLILENNESVRFHAMQSIVFSLTSLAINILLALTFIFSFLIPLFLLIEFILWLLMMYKASQGEKWELPVLGKWVNKLLS